MSLQTRRVLNLYRRARSCSEALHCNNGIFIRKSYLCKTVQSCYRKLCIVVTEIGALLLPKSEHSRLPKSVHFSLPFTTGEKLRKTDAIDSGKLAGSLRAGELKGIYVPDKVSLEIRSLIRLRDSVTKDQTRQKNRIKSHLRYLGIEIPREYCEREEDIGIRAL